MNFRPGIPLAACVTHGGDEPFRVVRATLDDEGRCAQCAKMRRKLPEPEPEALVLFDVKALDETEDRWAGIEDLAP